VLGLGAPLQNSRHSLRSLWSNTCNESVHEAREYARGPRALRSSPPHRRARRLPRPGLAGTSVTCDYLTYLRKTTGDAARELEPFDEAYAKTDWSRFERLPLAWAASRTNAYNTYLLMEQQGGR